MQLLVTHGRMARTRVLHLSPWALAAATLALAALLMLLSGAVYHFVFLKAAREGWPVVSPIVRLVVRDEIAQRDRFMRDNLDAIAQKVGEMQAKLVKLEAMGDRVIGLAGVKADELKLLERPAAGGLAPGSTHGQSGGQAGAAAGGRPLQQLEFIGLDAGGLAPGSTHGQSGGQAGAAAGGAGAATTARPPRGGGSGGPYVPLVQPSLDQLRATVDGLDLAADLHTDIFTLVESRLLESRLASLQVPSSPPVAGPAGSGFGFRADPITGRAALHTGLDFPADVGTPIRAAAGGIVVARDGHAAYGQVLEIDHGNGLLTRYAHCAGISVAVGALVKRGQQIATVGTTGRTTGPHLHFEVLVDGVPQNPERFLGGATVQAKAIARRPPRR